MKRPRLSLARDRLRPRIDESSRERKDKADGGYKLLLKARRTSKRPGLVTYSCEGFPAGTMLKSLRKDSREKNQSENKMEASERNNVRG